MRIIKRLILGAMFALVFASVANTNALNTQDFYFTDFAADYYLTKLEDGTSNLHVKEVLTAVFPDHDQNHGITRTIPYTNQGGKNTTVANESALNLTVLRNGEPENVSKITKNDGYYTVYIGSASSYVHGEQTYTLEYDYTNVITEFDENGNNVSGEKGVEKILQELYWDTNGTGWNQSFNKLTANLHTPGNIYENMGKEAWCYVGKYGEKGSDRCTVTPTDDGFSFNTGYLGSGENLTFAVDFEPDTFTVPTAKSATGTYTVDTQNFYFTDFTADYFLTKLEDGTSNLHVKEVLTAVFPEYDQNHGITRTIPYTNQDGTNRTVESENALNLTVLRNGEPESVSNVVKNNGYYTVYIGSASSYVHGEQVYTLEYDYTDVITEFDADGNNVSGKEGVEKLLQELYWDTNGTGWNQSFEHLTANLHTTKDIYKNMDTTAWCYVGSYGEKGQDKCTITPTSDGFSFTTGYLEERENLTFVVQFKPDTFYVLLEKNYILVILLSIEIAIMAFLIIRRIIKWRKCGKDMKVLYKSLFTTPQYQPPEDTCICTAEGEQIYLQKTKSSYVATLLELAVSKKITVKKVENERKYDWAVILNVEPDELTGPQKQMMNILSGNGGLAKGDEIPIKKHTATRYLANCAERYKDDAVDTLKRRSYLREDDTKETSTIRFLLTYILIFFFVIPIAVVLLVREGETTLMLNAEIVGEKVIPAVFVIILIVGIVVLGILNGQIRKYSKYTESGIKLAKYLEGLELYIKMAEADRLKFLQSVEGADTSEAGIVKLYERLLPWASLFGAEESWVKELAKYYEVGNVDEAISSDVLHGIIAANIAHDVSRAITSSTNYHEPSSSGGSWSSSSSGGGSFSSGGGGFSGGGGGGGGGGGW